MLRNYVLTAYRNFIRNKAYSAINVTGLALGLACTFFIFLWVRDELSTNTFHEHSEDVYRVMRHATFGGTRATTPSMPKPLDDVFDTDYPEIMHSVLMDWGSSMVLTHGDQVFRANGRYFDVDVFDVFTIPMIAGDPSTALLDPNTIAINESLATRLFGDAWNTRTDVLGSIIRVDNRIDMQLTGVFEDVPDNSSIDFEFVLPMQEYISRNDWVENWGNNGLRMFVRLRPDADLTAVNNKIKDLIDDQIDMWESDVFLQPLPDMYLRSDYEDGQLVGGRISYIRIFVLVGVFILLIASINFMNLATARSAKRSREIGVRKSVGATRSLLARQFLGESMVTAIVALGIAVIIVAALLPSFNQLTDKSVTLSFGDVGIWGTFVGLALLTGFLAGSYPAMYLSSFNVVSAIRSGSSSRARGGSLRKVLVVFQFVMSIVLIVGTLTVYRQLNYIRSTNLGVDRDNVVFMDFEGGIQDQFDTFKQELLARAGIVNVAAASSNPLSIGQDTIDPTWDGKEEGDNTLFSIISAGYDFIETMKIDLISGRDFSRDFGADTSNFIVNETAAEKMGFDNPVGQSLAMWGREGTIVGMVKDFHMQSLYGEIEPVIFRLAPEDTWMLFVRIAAGQTAEGLDALEEVYADFNPEYPFNYRFMDEEFEETYSSEIVIGTLANWFAILAILIACLGLFGLASFTAEQRTKEIGIRKALGASVGNVVLLLSKEFIALVTGAFIVAAPAAYIMMSKWLNEFAFHVEFGVGILAAIAGLTAIMIAWLTVSYQSIRAAAANPVVSLRSE